MSDHLSLSPMLRAAVLAAALVVPLAACVQQPASDRVVSNAPMVPGQADLVGSGGQQDQIYRQIYTPGDPWWSQL